ncbi:MAG: DUF302 domain-containing protein [gamma proteobacterium symbiont of Bathyaustriella thionipta]|nr:DUF302 domain-containing protein [gamma proteobacterium symbiont of Bathyaustriella thionipta]MCU7950576.1 DUF302 domain-containing protein [gamma proteobacterium symbiont of Bathyaustriella thionipta]MCU7954644.1 DUF302 domain-containing protein [gamma proteobacterium symbiont of Bathyaustriella thionipta]MCU7957088.1 DUF302 domain-containing protein [gamma proteobacterium symbiont of Bathyaustriella thionipta]MCU7966304.1 DUF302 domain-containing protein [gamma proteobacterium symbiont of 
MILFKNILALVGLVAIIATGVLYMNVKNILSEFDPGAADTYMELFTNILETKDAASATVWRFPVEEGLTPEDIEKSLKNIANELNISNVGELPLSKDIAAKSEKPFRFVKIFLFCNSLTAAQMLEHNDAFSAYLPCRITLVEDKTGKLWLYTLNMDLMIHGGKPLPPALKAEAENVKKIILEIMERAAEGDF